MPHATVHRISTPRPAPAALLILTVSAALVLSGAPAHALPMADDDVSMTVSSEIVVKEDETYTAKFTMSDSGSTPTLSKSICNKETFDADESDAKDVTVEFKDEGDTRSCILQGTGSVSDSSSSISHNGDEFTVTTPDFNDQSSSTTVNITQSVTFPGKVTEADEGTVDGTKVSFNDGDSHQVKGKDKAPKKTASQDSEGESGSTPMWVWALVGVLAVAIVGGTVTAVVMNQRKKNHFPVRSLCSSRSGLRPQPGSFRSAQPAGSAVLPAGLRRAHHPALPAAGLASPAGSANAAALPAGPANPTDAAALPAGLRRAHHPALPAALQQPAGLARPGGLRAPRDVVAPESVDSGATTLRGCASLTATTLAAFRTPTSKRC